MPEFQLSSTALILAAYLMGSLSTAIIVCRIMGLPDPRTQGSNNPGATNVLRIGGKKAAAITLAGDAVKGLIPVLIGQSLNLPIEHLAMVALAAFFGHLLPVFFGFKGGKGVATAFGGLVALSWPVGIALLFTWIGMAYLSKISSLSALVAAALAPIYFYLWTGNIVLVVVSLLIAIILFWRHRSNIHQLIQGSEGKIQG
jgi:glycerol-3-phosphate acyltransferase PlsY